ncbi:MAG: hypothetical protein M3Y23_02100, partial [Actinomycetota bacterium]|nr:hypothetical protein [Actinomycetota bacterium]
MSVRLQRTIKGLGRSVACVSAVVAMAVIPATAGAEPPPPDVPFSITSFTTSVTDADGNELSQAGAHPTKANAKFTLSEYYDVEQGRLFPIEEMKSVITDLPPGFVGNPTSVPKCPLALLPTNIGLPPKCPAESAVGTITIVGGIFMDRAAVYNLVPERGYPAEFGFSILGFTYYLYPELRSDGDYGLRIVVDGAPYNQHRSVDMTFCGNGAENVGELWAPAWECKAFDPSAPQFLTNPASECTNVAPVTKLAIDSWTNPGKWKYAEFASPLITGCDTLTFEPSVDIAPTTPVPDAPTGLNVDMTFPQEDNAHGQAPPALKKAVVTLPEGMTINPAGAGGLEACTDGELLLKSKDPMTCPESSKVGTVTATSPLLDEPVKGGVYIRSQNSMDPESGEMFRLALVLQNKDRGIDIRLPGSIRADARTGR